jgi:hypothetical protein
MAIALAGTMIAISWILYIVSNTGWMNPLLVSNGTSIQEGGDVIGVNVTGNKNIIGKNILFVRTPSLSRSNPCGSARTRYGKPVLRNIRTIQVW